MYSVDFKISSNGRRLRMPGLWQAFHGAPTCLDIRAILWSGKRKLEKVEGSILTTYAPGPVPSSSIGVSEAT